MSQKGMSRAVRELRAFFAMLKDEPRSGATVSVKEAAVLLKVGIVDVQRMVARGELMPIRLRRSLRIMRSEIDALL